RGGDHDCPHGDRQHAGPGLVSPERHAHALRQHRGRGAGVALRRHALSRALPLRLRAPPHDLPRPYARGRRPAPPPRPVPGDLMSLRKDLARGEHLIWLTGSALGVSLLMILGLLAVILTNGLGIFWPSRIEQITLKDGTVLAGELVQRQAIP